jgi:hypothetical protein
MIMELILMSKKLNIIEAMKMPLGTEFEVIFDGKKIPNNTMVIYRSLASDRNTKHIDWKSHPDGTFMKPYDYLINGVFIPIQQPVSFMEVVKSGKKCKVEHELIDTDLTVYSNKKISDFNDLDWVLFTLTNNQIDIKTIIQEGKWYIEESEVDSNE